MPPCSLTNFEIQKYYKNEPRFNGVFSRNNLPKKIKDGAYVINLDEYADVGTHWIALFCNRNEIVYFDSFGVEHIPEEIKEFIDRISSSASQNKNIKANIFRLDEVSEIENCFHEEINQRKLCSQKLSKYVAAFYYIDKILIVLSATSGGVSIISFTSIVGAPVGIASASLTLFIALTTGISLKHEYLKH